MKKIITMVVCVMTLCLTATAQNYLQLNVSDIENHQVFQYCQNQYDSIVIVKDSTCNQTPYWGVGDHYGLPVFEGHFDQITLTPEMDNTLYVTYEGCVTVKFFEFHFLDDEIQEPWDFSRVWKRYGTSVTLEAYAPNVTCEWSTGQTGYEITIAEPGTYWVHMYNQCSELWDTIQVCNNVELFRATTELEHNRNQATWQTTPEQAEYVQEVNVYRNNQLVAIVPYTDGVFTDNIGSADAPWQYHLVAVSNGEECPLRSYWARTISMSDLMGSQGTQTLTWTSYEQENPAKGDEVQSYGIFDVVGGNPRLVMEVGSFVNMYNYDPSNFDGYAAVAAIFSRDGKSPLDFEDCAFSNRTEAPLGLGEHEAATFSVYPNPSNGVFTVEGAGMMTVMNVLGQIIKETEIDGQYIMELPQGIYFVKMGDETRKIVVE